MIVLGPNSVDDTFPHPYSRDEDLMIRLLRASATPMTFLVLITTLCGGER